MAKQIDERVVEMRFDNKQFEAGAKETMGTLAKLKEALNLSSSSKALENLDKAAQNINLEGIAAGVEALNKRFSAFGIMGMRVIENLTDGLMNSFGKAVNFVSDSIVSGGIRRAMNIENAHFQLQALLKDEEKVQAVMDDAMMSVDGTAYAYDEAARAASQFAASGLQAGEDMQAALRGIVGVAAMTNSEYEGIAQIFTTVAGNGRLMGDQLLQLSSRGLNAASTIAEFVNGVNDGSKETTENVRQAVKEISGGLKVTEGDIREFVTDGAISFEIFSAAMTEAFADSAERANETFTGAFSNMKSALARIGAGFISPLIEQNSEVVKMFNAIRVKINDVKKALVFDEEIGNVHALSKQFTDTVLALAKAASSFIENMDLSKPLNIFYHGVESIKNIVKGLFSILKPLGEAFAEVFLTFSIDDIVSIAEKIEDITSNMRLTDKASKNLKDTLKGLFSVIKLVIDGFLGLFGITLEVGKPINSLFDLFLELTGALGRVLTSFTGWVRSSPKIAGAFNLVRGAVSSVMKYFAEFISWIGRLANAVYNMDATQRAISKITQGFKNLGVTLETWITKGIGKLKEFKNMILDFIPDDPEKQIMAFVEKVKELGIQVSNLDFSGISGILSKFGDRLQSVGDKLMENEGIRVFVTNLKIFMKELGEAFSADSIFDKINKFNTAIKNFALAIAGALSGGDLFGAIDKFKEKFDGFGQWLKDKVLPLFEDFSIGGAVAGGTGIGIIYSMIKAAKSFETATDKMKAIPDLLGGIKGALTAYQKDLKADALMKTAKAIAILAGALVLLSFADSDRALEAAGALSIIAGSLLIGVERLSKVINRGKTLEDGIFQFSKGIKSALKKLGRAVEIKAIGSALKDFAKTIGIIAISLIALAVMYGKDKDSLMGAIEIVEEIGKVLIGVMVGMTVIGSVLKKGGKNFALAAAGVMGLSLSLSFVVSSLAKLFKMELPDDYEKKLKILGAIFIGLGALALALGGASWLSGGKKFSSGPILALTAMLYVTVLSLDKLFRMTLPDDWKTKMTIMGGIFLALGGVMIAIGAASKLAGGAIKATGTILAMCVFLATVTASLMILSIIPGDKLMTGATSLGLVLMTLGLALYGASKITTEDTWKSILAMAVAVGAITASLGVLSMISWQDLLKSTLSLGSVLLAMAVALREAGKVNDTSSVVAILAMIAAMGAIAIALYALSEQPWERMLASGASMSAVLLAFAYTLKTISKSSGIKIKKIGNFILACVALAPIGYTLYKLSEQPWDGMLASAAALSAVLFTFSKLLKTISASSGIKIKKIGNFILACVALAPIGAALYFLSEQPWDGMLASAAALSAVLMAMAGVFSFIGTAGELVKVSSIGKFILACVALAPVGVALYFLAEKDWNQLLGAAGALSLVLVGVSAAFLICSAAGSLAWSAVAGLAAFDVFLANFALILYALGKIFEDPATQNLIGGGASILAQIGNAIGAFAGNIIGGFIGGITEGLPVIGENLSEFMEKAQPFFDGAAGIDEGSMNGIKSLAEAILILTGADILRGLTSWLTGDNGGLAAFGAELEEFGPSIKAYADSVAGIDASAVEASASAAKMMAETAKKLPNSGGLAAKIFGDNSLASFGKELEKFGPSIKKYANTVAGLDSEAVEASANAAQVMSDMASKLPNSGGLAAKILGDNTLSSFGAELARFGPLFKKYATSVAGLDANVVINSANAAQSLSELANNLPNSGGFVSWFTGDNDLQAFGEKLKSFGESFAAYYASIATIDNMKLLLAIASFGKMIDLAERASGVDVTAMSSLTEGLKKAAETGVKEFSNAFQNSGETAAAGMNVMLTSALNAIQGKDKEFSSKGTVSIDSYVKGMKNRAPEVASTTVTLALKALQGLQQKVNEFLTKGSLSANQYLTGIKNKYGEAGTVGSTLAQRVLQGLQMQVMAFTALGEAAAGQYIQGFRNKSEEASSLGNTLAENALNGIRGFIPKYEEAGEDAAKGFIKGLKSQEKEAEKAAANLGMVTYLALKKNLQIKSPSRKMAELGDFAGLGYVNKLYDYVGVAEQRGEEIGESTVEGVMSKVGSLTRIQMDFDSDPVIRPTVDLSNVEKSIADINDMFNRAISMTINNTIDLGRGVDSLVQSRIKKADDIQNQGEKSGGDTYYNLEQNNYSPKALSRIDIYRDTKNLFSSLERKTKT